MKDDVLRLAAAALKDAADYLSRGDDLAAECLALAAKLNAKAKGPTASAGPTDPIDPPPHPK